MSTLSKQREEQVPHWTNADRENLYRRIQRLAPKPVTVSCTSGCATGDHSHARRPVGPYQVCRCLQCPILVVA